MPWKDKSYAKKYQRMWREEHPAESRLHRKTYRDSIRNAVFEHYGLSCACCGESQREFLCIDHINGGGHKQRKSLNLWGVQFYNWLIRNNFPGGFQTLCYNCNQAKAIHGECPHKKHPAGDE